MRENLEHAGGAWGPKKAWQIDVHVKRIGRQGPKLSAPRIAKQAGVSVDFLNSLRGYDVRYRNGAKHYTNRERSNVVKVLEVLGLTEEEFLAKADGRLL